MRNTVQQRLCRAVVETLESRRLLSISVNAANEWWDAAENIGGVNIGSHNNWNNFVEGEAGGVNIPFQADADIANIPLIRTNAYPDNRNVGSPNNSLAFFDAKVQAILNAGAQPLLISYINPGLNYYNIDGTLGTGGTYATNLVWLVKHYMAAPFNLQKQYWEIGNEPESAIDYKVSSWVEYAQIYRECHEALVAAGLRDNVVLGAAVTAGPYANDDVTPLRNNMHRYLLATNPDAINWMNWHSYVGAPDLHRLINDYWKVDTLNGVHRTIELGHTNNDRKRDWADPGLAALMAQYNLTQDDVGIAITETNTWNKDIHTNHTLQSGLWHLATSSLMLQNPMARANNLFIFDDTNVTGISVYNAAGQKDYTYWSLYILGNLVGDEVLQQVTTSTTTDPGLLVTATKDNNYVYLQVINRTASSITDTVSLSGMNITGQVTKHVLSATATPNNGTPVSFTSGANQTFAAYTATVFKIPYTAAAGFGLAVDDSYKMVAPGGTRRYTVTVQRQGGFSAAVTPTITPPANMSAIVTHAGGDTWYVDLTPSSGIQQGAYYLTVEANVSGQVAKTPMWLVVAKPGFRVEPAVHIHYEPQASTVPIYSVNVAAGNKALARVSVIPSGGFTGNVNLSVSGLPAGATYTPPGTIADAGYSLMEINVPSGTPAGTYNVTVTGTSGSLSHAKTFQLVVAASGTKPNNPSSLVASVIDGKAVRLSWVDNSSNETSFSIERSTDGGNTYKELISFNSNNLTGYTDVSVQPGQSYQYRIRAFNAAGTSDYATSNQVAVVGSGVPAAPSSLTATAVAAGQINLAWTDNSNNESNFVIERATNSSFTQNLKTYTPPANSTAFADVLLSPNTTYYFRIKAVNGSGSSAYSNTDVDTTYRGQSIRFETSEGYTTTGGTGGGGNVVGQPSTPGATKWSGSGLFNVLSGVGSGGQGIRSTTGSFAAYSATTYTPAAVDFQGDASAVTSGFNGVIGFSFDLAVHTALHNGSSSQAWDFLFSNNAVEILLMANGKLNIQTAAGNFNAKTTSGGTTDFDFDTIGLNNFVRLRGEIDYGSNTFTLYVNNVLQKTAGGASAISFRNASAATHFDTVRLQTRTATTASDHVRITIDNLTFSQVPIGGFAAMSSPTSSKPRPVANTDWVTLAEREEERRKRLDDD